MDPKVRRPIVAGNWKMNKGVAEARSLAIEVKHRTIRAAADMDVVVCPPFVSLAAVGEVLKGSRVMLGAQNCFWEDRGAYTGETSALMLKDVGCDFVIVGHSERREHFGESDDWVARKAEALLRHGLSPILCVGERLADREAARTNDVVRGQVLGSLKGITAEGMLKTVVAYEPVWAIGTGRTATPDEAQEVHAFIRNLLIDLFGLEVALRTRIQYGGSVKADNIRGLMAEPDIDGALVGGASLDASGFAAITSCAIEGET